MTYLSFLKGNKDFIRLWVGGFAGRCGDAINYISCALLAVSITGGSSGDVGAIIGLRFLIKVIGGNIGGFLADHYDKRRLLIILDLCMALVVSGGCMAGSISSIWFLFLFAMLMGGLNTLFVTVRLSFIPTLVGKHAMTYAVALDQIGSGASMFVGSVIGGAVAGWLGFRAAFAVNCAVFMISAICTWSTRRGEAVNDNADVITKRSFPVKPLPPRKSFSIGMLEGASYLRGQPMLWKMILFNCVWALGGGGVIVVVTIINQQRFGGSENLLGILYAMIGVAAFMVLPFRSQFGKKTEKDLRFLGVFSIVEGILFVALVLISNLKIFIMIFALQMAASFVFGLIYQPLLIKQASDKMRGRVLGVDYGLTFALYGMAATLYGFMLNHIDVIAAGLIGGGIMSVAGILWITAVSFDRICRGDLNTGGTHIE